MAKKISQLTQATEVKSDDVTVIVQDGETKKLPLNMMVTKQDIENKKVAGLAKLDEIEATYENDTYTPTITVKNKSSVKTGEGDEVDYSANVMDGHAKSAILKGNTLVNVLDYKALKNSNQGASYTYDGKYLTNPNTTDHSPWNNMKSVSNLIKPNTNYFVMLYNPSSVEVRTQMTFLNSADATKENFNISLGERVSYKVVSPSNANGLYLKFFPEDTATPNTKLQIMILEYQQGMENWDIPYFEGMQSVKMPVLTTSNLGNLLKREQLQKGMFKNDNGVVIPTADMIVSDFIVREFDEYTLSHSGSWRWTKIFEYDGEKVFIQYSETRGDSHTAILNGRTKFIRIAIEHSFSLADTLDIKLCPYASRNSQPYKSNILTTPSDLVLRRISEVQDTLDLTNGKLVENISEVVLNGSENWQIRNFNSNNTECTVFTINLEDKVSSTRKVISDKFSYISNDVTKAENVEGIYGGGGNISFFINVSNSKATTVEGFKNWLSTNNVTIQYLKTHTIKTVDLSDNHVYSYKGTTHYDCSSAEGSLVPTLSVKVPTDVQATIAQQRETIQTLNSENERLNQIQEALKASMLDSQVQLMNLSWNTDFEVFTLRESIAPKDFLLASRTGSNIDKFSQAKFIIENDCPDLEKLNSQIEYYFSKDVFSQEQFEELTDLISIVKGENGCEY